MTKPKVTEPKDYILKGVAARLAKLPRENNPYNMRSHKGHLWDMGWCEPRKINKLIKNTLTLQL